MNITIERKASINGATLGVMYIDGLFFCYTLEDVVRELKDVPVKEWKIKGETAIPSGTYKLVIDYSNRYKRPMPHILNVEGFEGIRIHGGNTSADTEGCILLGDTIVDNNKIANSKIAFNRFFEKLDACLKDNKEVLIRLENCT